MPVIGEIVFDGTARSIDADGRLHISKTHISKATVNPYFGREIPRYVELNLNPSSTYYMLRDPVELARAAATFARLPILTRHVAVNSENIHPEAIGGTIGSDVEFNDPYLDADVCIWDAAAISRIEDQSVREFSCSYRYRADMTPGEYHGQRYDGVMRDLHGNHLALVEAGRAGSDVLAADEEPMKRTKLGDALVLTLGSMAPALAQDSAFIALVGQASSQTINVADVSGKLLAMDAALTVEKTKPVFDTLLALDKKAKDEEKEEDDETPAQDCGHGENGTCSECKKAADKKARDSKRAKDEENEEKAMDAKLTIAMDEYKAQVRDANEARIATREVIGDVAMDSAAAIYEMALDRMNVGHKGVTQLAGLKALFEVSRSKQTPTPVVAMDSAGLLAQFPEAARFRHM